ncbi:hypothetical protein STVA_29720 [Allostella vacuolata]|nr:hypothetical protein STVA_29720 [Stella vacuolata]
MLALAASGSAAGAADIRFYTGADPVPAAVVARVTCDRVGMSGQRRAFAGGFLFQVTCPGNHANHMQAFVLAAGADGQGARTLLFPGPGRTPPVDAIANPRINPRTRQIAELSVDPEAHICRSEARWRIAGPQAPPRLVFWRQTRDCTGRRGWKVLAGRR